LVFSARYMINSVNLDALLTAPGIVYLSMSRFKTVLSRY